jgi:glycosyltransferase involved in cell wall biosynthesis
MNILILNWKDIKNPTSGGAELVTYEHARRWVKDGNNVTWLSSAYKGCKSSETIDGVNIKRFGNIYGVYFYAPFFYLFSGNKFDIVVDEVHGIPFFTPLYVRKPVLVLIHEVANEIWDYMYSFPFNKIGKLLEKFYLKLYANRKFWTASEYTINELVRNGIPRKSCHAIPCPSNASPLTKLPQKNKKITIVSVSRIVKMKGIEDVIDAFSEFKKIIKDAQLLIIGDGEKSYVNYLKKKRVAKLGLQKAVKFLGFVDEKKKLEILRKSHLLFHASVKEGWGIVVIEAASQATPAVVYNVPGLNESVKNNVTGIVINENTPLNMAISAEKLLNNEKKYIRLQKNALNYANELNWDNSVKESMKLIKNLTK